MFKKKKIYVSLIGVLALCFVIGFSVTDANGQKGGKGRYRKVSLKKDARKNGYTVTEQGRKEYFLQIFAAQDPLTKRRLEGEKEVEFRCKEIVEKALLRLLFKNGNTERVKIECLILIEPQILLLDEPE